MDEEDVVERLRGKLIVSCQALEDEPLHGSEHMVAMVRGAIMGGAGAIRANSPQDIAAIRAVTELPLIGLWKRVYDGYEPYITTTIGDARQIADAGADIVAVDATARLHAGGLGAEDLIRSIKAEIGIPVMADISTLEEGINAERAGADIVSTTLCGYTSYTLLPEDAGPSFDLLEELVKHVECPVVAEGRIWTPEEACMALSKGAFAVTVGSAITRPQLITKRFAQQLSRHWAAMCSETEV